MERFGLPATTYVYQRTRLSATASRQRVKAG
jgi:hypothetical protein